MISHIHSTTVIVSDQDAARAFYVDVLGWKVGTDNLMGPGMRWLTVVPPGGTTELVLATPTWGGPERPPGGYVGITLVAPDIETAYAELRAKGVRFKEPVTTMPWGSKATWFFDPDGNEFFLVDG